MEEGNRVNIKYEYALEVNHEFDNSLKNLNDDQVKNMVSEENAKNLKKSLLENGLELSCKMNGKVERIVNGIENGTMEKRQVNSDYVYVLEPENRTTEELEKDFKMEELPADMAKDITKEDSELDEDGEDSEPRLIIDMSKGSSVGETSIRPETVKGSDVSNKEDTECDVERGVAMVPRVNKRKRMSNMNNALPSIVGDKLQNGSGENNFRVNGQDVPQGSVEKSDDTQPIKRLITEQYVTNNSLNSASPKLAQDGKSTGKKYGVIDVSVSAMDLSKADDSVLDLSQNVTVAKSDEPSPLPLNLVTSTPNVGSSNGRKKRRKNFVPVKVEKTSSNDVNEFVEEYVGQEINDNAKDEVNEVPMDLTPKSNVKKEINDMHKGGNWREESVDSPMDLSARNSPISSNIKKELLNYSDLYARNSPVNLNIKKEPGSHTGVSKPARGGKNGPVDLSARNSPVNVQTPPARTSISSINSGADGKPASLLSPGVVPGMVPGFNPLMTGMNQNQMKEFLEMMLKLQPNFPNPSMLHANAQMMQFQALMQNAMLNNNLMSLNKQNVSKTGGGQVKSDKNDNIVKMEPAAAKPDNMPKQFQNYNFELMQKNGILQNGLVPGMNGLSPAVPFLPNQNLLTPKGQPGRRKRNHDSSFSGALLDRTTIPKLEDIPLLRTHVETCSPDAVVDALKQLFPLHPSSNTPNQETGVEGNIRFFVKDNEQIQTIVDSLLVVCEIMETEGKQYAGEQGYRNVCRLCNATFFHIEHLTKHIKKLHIVKRFQCTECDR